MHKKSDTNSEKDTLVSDKMSKKRKSSRHSYFKNRLVFIRLIWVLLVSCFISFIFVLIIFYLNSNRILNLYSNIILSPSSTTDTSVQHITQLSKNVQTIKYNDFNYLKSNTLTYENRTYSNNVQILFRLPEKIPISALLLIFHGCSRSAHDWFHTIERQRIIGAAIDLGYGCLAFQSTDESSRCWSNHINIDENDDVQMIFKGLKGFYKEYPKLESLPRFTFGASSGGIFSSIFAINQHYKIQGQILFISFVSPEILERYVKTKSYPSTAWIYMIRDIEFASEDRINRSMKIFAEQKIPHISFSIEPISLTARTFNDRIPSITIETSNYIFYRFQQNQWLDSQNYFLYNPRRKDTWQTFLFTLLDNEPKSKDILENLNTNKHIFPDILNTIYGEHEISFERSFEALQWLKNIYNNNQINSIM